MLENLKEPGWQVILIPEDEEGPAFAFTIGLFHSFKHPEVLVMGLSLETMHHILNDIGSQIKQGQQFGTGEAYPGILEGADCTFRHIHQQNYREFLGAAGGFYQSENFPALQCFWPDKQGRYPWQPEFESRLVEYQWNLSETGYK